MFEDLREELLTVTIGIFLAMAWFLVDSSFFITKRLQERSPIQPLRLTLNRTLSPIMNPTLSPIID